MTLPMVVDGVWWHSSVLGHEEDILEHLDTIQVSGKIRQSVKSSNCLYEISTFFNILCLLGLLLLIILISSMKQYTSEKYGNTVQFICVRSMIYLPE